MDAWIEAFGLLASVVVAVSLTMRNLTRLRQINLVGSIAFAAYGLLIGSWPVFALNAFIALVNLRFLRRAALEAARPETFEILPVDPAADAHARRFLAHHLADIRRFFPSFDPDPIRGTLAGAEACFILRGTLPVSLVAYRRGPPGPDGSVPVELLLDYAVPAYRDYKNARFFLDSAAPRIAAGASAVLTAVSEAPAHAAYLRRLGFEERGSAGPVVRFEKRLPASFRYSSRS